MGDLGFQVVGAPTSYTQALFGENACENIRIGSRCRGWVRPLGSTNEF